MKEMLTQLQEDNKGMREAITSGVADPSNPNFYKPTTAAASMTPQIRKKVEELIQEPIADMPTEAQSQFTKLVESHSTLSDQIVSLTAEVKAAKNAASSQDVARLSQEVAKIMNLSTMGMGPNPAQTPGNNPTTPMNATVNFGNTVKFPMKTPNTPGGQAMLSKQLNALSLPPEEWAEEVRELNGQLIEALEQLSDREKELDDHEELLRRYEGHLGSMRQQTALLYKEHMEATEKATTTEQRLNRTCDELRAEREALTLRVERYVREQSEWRRASEHQPDAANLLARASFPSHFSRLRSPFLSHPRPFPIYSRSLRSQVRRAGRARREGIYESFFRAQGAPRLDSPRHRARGERAAAGEEVRQSA